MAPHASARLVHVSHDDLAHIFISAIRGCQSAIEQAGNVFQKYIHKKFVTNGDLFNSNIKSNKGKNKSRSCQNPWVLEKKIMDAAPPT